MTSVLRITRTSVLVFLLGLVYSPEASAQLPNLADITGINIDLPKGRVSVGTPQNPAETVQRTIHAVVGAPLKQAILSARANAGALHAVPANIARELVALGVSPDLVSRARWSSNWRAVDTIFTADQAAVCLQDILVFRNADDARNDVALWVHELKHFEQYERMGLDAFAAEYTVNSRIYENEAEEAANRARGRLASTGPMRHQPSGPTQGAISSGSLPGPPPVSLAQHYYSYCSTPVGNSPTIPGGQPPGSPCSFPTRWGLAFGFVVGFVN